MNMASGDEHMNATVAQAGGGHECELYPVLVEGVGHRPAQICVCVT